MPLLSDFHSRRQQSSSGAHKPIAFFLFFFCFFGNFSKVIHLIVNFPGSYSNDYQWVQGTLHWKHNTSHHWHHPVLCSKSCAKVTATSQGHSVIIMHREILPSSLCRDNPVLLINFSHLGLKLGIILYESPCAKIWFDWRLFLKWYK